MCNTWSMAVFQAMSKGYQSPPKQRSSRRRFNLRCAALRSALVRRADLPSKFSVVTSPAITRLEMTVPRWPSQCVSLAFRLEAWLALYVFAKTVRIRQVGVSHDFHVGLRRTRGESPYVEGENSCTI